MVCGEAPLEPFGQLPPSQMGGSGSLLASLGDELRGRRWLQEAAKLKLKSSRPGRDVQLALRPTNFAPGHPRAPTANTALQAPRGKEATAPAHL